MGDPRGAARRLRERRAGRGGPGGWSPAANGRVIEQAQILTTYNLALVFEALGLSRSLRSQLGELAQGCFEFVADVCSRREVERDRRAVKNAAFAWRQLLFFLSHADDDEQLRFLSRANATLAAAREEPKRLLAPLVRGLQPLVPRAPRVEPGPALRPFLGWAEGQHPLFAL